MTEAQSQKPLWSWAALAAVCDADADGAPARPISGISIDSRTIALGDLFVALKDQRDGHDFVLAAFKNGAAAALVAKSYAKQAGDGALLRVDDPLCALEDAGRIARFRTDAKIVAITGSVGKTGTKEMLRQCLARVGQTHASEKSYNNHWGVPLTLARMPEATEYGIFEIGMNHPGEIAPLVRMVAPDAAVITTVEPVHLGQFASLDEIAEAKSEILLGLPAGGTVILNRDNAYFDMLSMRAEERSIRVISFGRSPHADIHLISADAAHDGSAVTASVRGRAVSFHLGAPGQHYIQNALAVVAALDVLDVDLDAALAALADISAPQGRGAHHKITFGPSGKILLIDESYNANPASMRAALAVLGTVPRDPWSRRIAVLGDMRELGATADALHRALAPPIADAKVDLVFCCGEHMRALFDALPSERRGAHTRTSLELVPLLQAALQPGDVVTIKGSLGTNMAPLVKAVRN